MYKRKSYDNEFNKHLLYHMWLIAGTFLQQTLTISYVVNCGHIPPFYSVELYVIVFRLPYKATAIGRYAFPGASWISDTTVLKYNIFI